MLYLQIFITNLIITLFTIPIMIKYFRKVGIVDSPAADRKIHTTIMPRMGGIVVYAAIILSIFVFMNDINEIRFLIVASVVLVICGIIDDLVNLQWGIKFAMQFISSLLITIVLLNMISETLFLSIVIPKPFDLILIFFLIVGVFNALNLMDGLDGLASGYALINFVILLAFGYLHSDKFVIIVSVAMLGSLIGFLKYNAFPAQIFLGDSGSLTLGFFLIVSSLWVGKDISVDNNLDLTFPVLILGVPIVDTLKVMFVRIKCGKNPFSADKNHLHHIIIGKHIRHKTAVFIIHAFSLIFAIVALNYALFSKELSVISFVLLSMLLLSAKSILPAATGLRFIHKLYHNIGRLVYRFIAISKKYIFIISTIGVIGLVMTQFPIELTARGSYPLAFLFLSVVMFIFAYVRRNKLPTLTHFYIFISITIFFSLTFLEKFNNHSNTYSTLIESQILYYIFLGIVVGTVVLFFLARESIISKDKIFLSGFDLIVVVFTSLSFLLQNFINTNWILIVSSSFSISLLIYFWYRIIVDINPQIERHLYYTFCISPVILISISLL